jgi:hypothetical protein
MSSALSSPSILFWPTLSKVLGLPLPPQIRSTFGSSDNNTSEHLALSRALSYTLAMSLTLVVLRWVRERMTEQKALRDGGDHNDADNADHEHDWRLQTLLYVDLRHRLRAWYSQCVGFVQRAATAAHNCFPVGRKQEIPIEADWTPVTHTGSCQCRAVRFQVRSLSIFLAVLVVTPCVVDLLKKKMLYHVYMYRWYRTQLLLRFIKKKQYR